ncbi:MAG: hypothetical protein AAGG07_00445 [Planctomycetota bacterium]
MNTADLFELAALDAFGLLDEHEAAEFETAFRSAPPAVQAQLRAEQTRYTHLEELLPDATPGPDLRARVLARVAAARAAEEAGSDRRVHEGGRRSPVMPIHAASRGSRVSSVWRASAIGFATAAVVLAGATIHFQNNYRGLRDRLSNDELVHGFVQEAGATVAQGLLFDKGTVRHHLRGTGEGAEWAAKATLFSNPEWDTSWFVCQDLPADDGVTYQLVRLDDSGEVAEVLFELSASGRLYSARVAINDPTRVAVASVRREGSTLVSSVVMSV